MTPDQTERIAAAIAAQQVNRLGEAPPSVQAFNPDYPIFKQIGRTGSTRYTPELPGDKKGRVLIHWWDSITIQEYDEMRFDGQIRAGLQLVKLPVMRSHWTIQCEDQDISAFVQEMLKPIWADLIRQLLLALDFGYAVFEKVWWNKYDVKITRTQGQVADNQSRVYPVATVLRRLLPLDPVTLQLLAYRRSGEFAGVKQYIPDTDIIPAEKCLLFSNEQEFLEHYGVSRLKACYPYWIFKKLMYEWTNVFFETYSVPARKVRYPIGASEIGVDAQGNPTLKPNQEVAMEIAEELRNNHSVVLPGNQYEETGQYMWDVEFMETARSSGDHIAYIDHLNLMILKSLLVPQLALETGSSGTYNLAQEQIDFFLQGEEALMEQVASVLTNQLIKQMVVYNFGPRAPQAILRFEPLTKDMRQLLGQTFVQMLSQGAPVPLGNGQFCMPDWQWVAEVTGIPVQVLEAAEAQAQQKINANVHPPPMPEYGGGPDAYGAGEVSGYSVAPGSNYPPASGGEAEFSEEVYGAAEGGAFRVVDGQLVWTALSELELAEWREEADSLKRRSRNGFPRTRA